MMGIRASRQRRRYCDAATWLRGCVFALLLVSLSVPCWAQNGQPAAPVYVANNRINASSVVTFAEQPMPAPPGQIAADPVLQGGVSAGLTLGQLEEIAIQRNPTLAQAAAHIQASQGRSVQVGLYPNPVLSYQGNEIGNDGRAGQQGGFISQEIVTAGKLKWNRAVADQETRQAESAWEQQRFRVLTDVRRSFYEVLVAQQSEELAEQLVAIGQRGVHATESLFKAKEVPRADLLQARIEADHARIVLEKAKGRRQGAWRSLTAVLGDPTIPMTAVAGDLREGIPSYTWEETLNRLLAESPELAGAKLAVSRAEAALGRECAGRTPNVDVQAGVQYDNATRSTIAGLQVGVPLQIYNRNQGNIQKAQAELVAAQQEVSRVRLSLQRRLAVVFEQYATAQRQTERYARDILPNARESLNLVSAGYRQGELSFLAFLTAEKTYFETTLAYLDSLRSLREAASDIEGNLLKDGLLAPTPFATSLQD